MLLTKVVDLLLCKEMEVCNLPVELIHIVDMTFIQTEALEMPATSVILLTIQLKVFLGMLLT
jgi:hypothetical protein